MPFVKLVVSELNCPRCNAWAQLRIEEERDNVCIVYIVCSKCKLHKYNKLLTRRAVTLMSKRDKLTDKLSSPIINETIKAKIRKMITVLSMQIQQESLKTGG